ncbi:hypothetical protein [Chitinophaga sp. Cy-1792]|uniref:hypothetical protein n=1 Tax=Chitinophaga sp. Cy-1792 TaxID=2608339 RepID=UPI0014249A1E|nr:hypothetical protein [Chitinophaga sp. Cy-1792]NIG56285.1 hypothetical protein [Chitinophaga sp. Cy-1792]
MKKLLLLISLCLGVTQLMQAQNSPYQFYKLQNQNVIFEKVYAADSLNQTDLLKQLQIAIPRIQGFTHYQENGNVITGRIINGIVDYRRFGHPLLSAPALIMFPYEASVTIEVKDGRYRVTMAGITFIDNSGRYREPNPIDGFLANNSKTEWKTGKTALKIGQFSEEYFSSIFTVTPSMNW